MVQQLSMPHEPSEAAATPAGDPKWFASVNDAPFPMPRRRMKARDIKAQAGVKGVLVRDLNQPQDVAIEDDTEVDLAEGNVFRTVDQCSAPPTGGTAAMPKLAFAVDDSQEITVQGEQTRESLIGLFDLPEDVRIFRDHESPFDDEIHPKQVVRHRDGPVFRIELKSITVTVNVEHRIRFSKRRVTGREFKKTAIGQGVPIDMQCLLYRVKPSGGMGPRIDDDEVIVLHCADEFRCVAPDDNS